MAILGDYAYSNIDSKLQEKLRWAFGFALGNIAQQSPSINNMPKVW
jgi:hypothetical protein